MTWDFSEHACCAAAGVGKCKVLWGGRGGNKDPIFAKHVWCTTQAAGCRQAFNILQDVLHSTGRGTPGTAIHLENSAAIVCLRKAVLLRSPRGLHKMLRTQLLPPCCPLS